ncbi:hypothetical protein C8R45DRAFT_1219101 [Mycena sanguinolenta]|nr:hypothetical protein C8R45DRAFT_1219101 [Mycena sanguinolenta]
MRGAATSLTGATSRSCVAESVALRARIFIAIWAWLKVWCASDIWPRHTCADSFTEKCPLYYHSAVSYVYESLICTFSCCIPTCFRRIISSASALPSTLSNPLKLGPYSIKATTVFHSAV